MSFAGLEEITPTTLLVSILAVGMIAINLYIVYRLLAGRTVPSLSTFVLGGAILLSQAVFWGGVAYYLEEPTVQGFVIFSLAVQAMMVPLGLWFVTLVFEAGERPVRPSQVAWPIGLALLLLLNELLMSWAFAALVPGTLPTNLALLPAVGRALLVAASSAWYYWPMGVTMLVLVRWSGIPVGDRWVLYSLTGTTFIAPWAFEAPLVGAAAMAAIMAIAIVVLWKGVSSPTLTRSSIRLRIGVALAFLVMSAAWALSYALLPPSWNLAPFAVTMVLVMTIEAAFLLRTMLQREGSMDARARPLPTPQPSGESVPAVDRPDVPTSAADVNG